MSYPAFLLALQILGRNNGMSLKPVDEWPEGLNYDLLELLCAKLTAEELKLFLTGETEEVFRISKKYDLGWLSWFLGKAFVGDFNEWFYCQPTGKRAEVQLGLPGINHCGGIYE